MVALSRTDPPEPAPLYGPQVLRSKTTWALGTFALGLALVLLIPSPLRDWLRSGQQRATAEQPGAGATALPGLPTAPAPTPPGSATHAGGSHQTLPAPTGDVVAIEDPKGSMAHVYRALARSKRGDGVTRVLHYGDSLIDLDFITAPLRRALQRRFGDAGHGFVLAARPWRWYNQSGVSVASAERWDNFRLVGGHARDGRLGLGCAAVEIRSGRAWTRIATSGRVKASRIEVHYLRQPRGGWFHVELDGKRVARVDTAAPRVQPGFHQLSASDTTHTIRLKAHGKVRLFGLVLERGSAGLTWENLPLVSARFNQFVRLNQQHWAAQLRHRGADLVLFQFGANDTISYGGDIERYGRQVLQALKLVKRALPQSSCMVIGPLDRLSRSKRGRLISPRSVRLVAEKQRQMALEAGCAFWDGQQAMGGPGSMRAWSKRGLVLKDNVHLNVKGSEVFAERLERALLAGYRGASTR